MEDRVSRVCLDGFLVAGWSVVLGEAAPCVLSFEGFLGGLPRLLALRRARISGGTVAPCSTRCYLMDRMDP